MSDRMRHKEDGYYLKRGKSVRSVIQDASLTAVLFQIIPIRDIKTIEHNPTASLNGKTVSIEWPEFVYGEGALDSLKKKQKEHSQLVDVNDQVHEVQLYADNYQSWWCMRVGCPLHRGIRACSQYLQY